MTANRRALVVLVLTAVTGVAALLFGVDRLARGTAESLIAGEVQRQTGTSFQPEVELAGGSFLLQAVRGRYERVDVRLRGLPSGGVRVDDLEAELTGVRLPLHDLVLRTPELILVERTRERALLQYDDVNRYLGINGRPYTMSAAEAPGEVEITGTVRLLDRDHRVSVRAVLGAEDGALTVSPTGVDTDAALGRAAELLLAERFTFVVPLDALPFGQQVVDVAAAPEGILVHAAGEQVVVRAR